MIIDSWPNCGEISNGKLLREVSASTRLHLSDYLLITFHRLMFHKLFLLKTKLEVKILSVLTIAVREVFNGDECDTTT